MTEDETLKLKFYGNNSEEHRSLARQLRERGYEVDLITCSRNEPAILSDKMSYTGLRAVCDAFNIHPRG